MPGYKKQLQGMVAHRNSSILFQVLINGVYRFDLPAEKIPHHWHVCHHRFLISVCPESGSEMFPHVLYTKHVIHVTVGVGHPGDHKSFFVEYGFKCQLLLS